MDEEEECCLSDALLADVVERARAARQAIRTPYKDPEEAWLDGYVAGCFAGLFWQTLSIEKTQEEKETQYV